MVCVQLSSPALGVDAATGGLELRKHARPARRRAVKLSSAETMDAGCAEPGLGEARFSRRALFRSAMPQDADLGRAHLSLANPVAVAGPNLQRASAPGAEQRGSNLHRPPPAAPTLQAPTLQAPTLPADRASAKPCEPCILPRGCSRLRLAVMGCASAPEHPGLQPRPSSASDHERQFACRRVAEGSRMLTTQRGHVVGDVRGIQLNP